MAEKYSNFESFSIISELVLNPANAIYLSRLRFKQNHPLNVISYDTVALLLDLVFIGFWSIIAHKIGWQGVLFEIQPREVIRKSLRCQKLFSENFKQNSLVQRYALACILFGTLISCTFKRQFNNHRQKFIIHSNNDNY